MRLIDLDSDYIQETLYRRGFKTRQDIEEWLNNAPTIDAVPVWHGRWTPLRINGHEMGVTCSECNTTWDAESNFCPNCGATMDGGDGNSDMA